MARNSTLRSETATPLNDHIVASVDRAGERIGAFGHGIAAFGHDPTARGRRFGHGDRRRAAFRTFRTPAPLQRLSDTQEDYQMMATDRSSDRDRDAPTDQPVATVDATRIPRHCSAPECAETPEWAWRTDDGHLQYDRIGHLLVPCLCDEHKEEVDR